MLNRQVCVGLNGWRRARIVLWGVCLFWLGGILLLDEASAWEPKRTQQGAPQRWTRMPVDYAVDSAGLGDYFVSNKDWGVAGSEFVAIDNAFQPWRGATCSGTPAAIQFQSRGRVSSSTAIGYDRNCNGCNVNLIRFILTKETWRHDALQLAVTTTTFNNEDGQILDADMEINAGHFELSTQVQEPDNMRWDIQNTVTHEIGHMIGLDHSAEPAATMYASGGQKELSKRDLHTDDLQGVCALYKPKELVVPTYSMTGQERALGCSSLSGGQAEGWSWGLMGLLGLFWMRVRRRGESGQSGVSAPYPPVASKGGVHASTKENPITGEAD